MKQQTDGTTKRPIVACMQLDICVFPHADRANVLLFACNLKTQVLEIYGYVWVYKSLSIGILVFYINAYEERKIKV